MAGFSVGLMNAAGWAKTLEQAATLARVPVLSHVVVGSFTVAHREGNTGGTNFRVFPDGTSINSLGLPNGGLDYILSTVKDMVAGIRFSGKKSVVSIAGFSPVEFAELAGAVCGIGADIIEVNGGCPNVLLEEGKKVPISFEPDAVDMTLAAVFERVGDFLPVWFKTSPFSDPRGCPALAAVLNRYPLEAVVSSNTLPDTSAFTEDGNPALDVADNFGGMAGTALKPIALGQCRKLRRLLRSDIGLVGVGGIAAGRDVRDYERAGASSVQVGTAFFKNEDPRVFEDIVSEYLDLADAA
jgi:dihydroorotate dehydrogenase (fumarate)